MLVVQRKKSRWTRRPLLLLGGLIAVVMMTPMPLLSVYIPYEHFDGGTKSSDSSLLLNFPPAVAPAPAPAPAPAAAATNYKLHKELISSSGCKFLIMQKAYDFHYEIFESIALRYPLPWETLSEECREAGLSADTPISVDYALCVSWRCHGRSPIQDQEGWGWKNYFEKHLKGEIRVRTDGRFVQFGSVVGFNKEEPTKLGIDWHGYAAQIEATCTGSKNVWRWLQQKENHYCVLHGLEHDNPVPPYLLPRTCQLNPQHQPGCWFLPIDYPSFPRPPLPGKNQKLNICIPKLDKKKNPKNATVLVHALQAIQPQNVAIVLNGRNTTNVPEIFESTGMAHYLAIPYKQSQLRDYYAFQEAMSHCHVMVPLIEPFGGSMVYFIGNTTQHQGKLSGFISQLIGNRIPSLLHSAVVSVYRNELTAPYFEYNASNFTDAFHKMLQHFSV
jgi:hypothetical protein